jgi:hypothetical protein
MLIKAYTTTKKHRRISGIVIPLQGMMISIIALYFMCRLVSFKASLRTGHRKWALVLF